MTCHMTDLVVIHDSVERFYPHGIDVSVQYYPLGPVVTEVGNVSHNGGEETVLPFPGGSVYDSVEFVCGHCLRINVLPNGFVFQVLVGLVQASKDLAREVSQFEMRCSQFKIIKFFCFDTTYLILYIHVQKESIISM